MTTVFTLGDSAGERRCTASCHEAKGADCECVCGGRFHGAALRDGGVEAARAAWVAAEAAARAAGAAGNCDLLSLARSAMDAET